MLNKKMTRYRCNRKISFLLCNPDCILVFVHGRWGIMSVKEREGGNTGAISVDILFISV